MWTRHGQRRGQPTGILISSTHDGALALQKIPGLKPGKVDTPDMKFKNNPREMSLSGGSLKRSFKGVEHVIEPTKAGVFLRQGARRTRLPGLWPAGNSENDDSASLLWAGDLDGDGRIDLLFAYSGYNRAGACLYLSARAGPGELVVQAACHGGVGC